MLSFCFCAKLRTCAWANLMSSRSRLRTWAMARSISCGLRRKSFGDHLSNFSDNSRMAVFLRSSTLARMPSTVSRPLATAALIVPASIPRLSQRGMGFSLLSVTRLLIRLDDHSRAVAEHFGGANHRAGIVSDANDCVGAHISCVLQHQLKRLLARGLAERCENAGAPSEQSSQTADDRHRQ